MLEKTDAELYSSLAQKSESALRAIYDRYSRPLFGLIFRFTQNREATEEILHDIFAQLLSGEFKLEAEGSLKSWLFTLAKNRSLNYVKRKTRESSSSVDEIAGPQDIEAQALQKNLLEKLKRAETTLPDDLRNTWNLRKSGLDYQQIADRIGIPVGTVKSRMNRLVDFLKKEFEV